MPDDPILGYCVKCREKREIDAPQAVFLGTQGRPATQGTCPECGTRMTRFGHTSAHDGLDPAASPTVARAFEVRLATGPKMVIVESPAKARTVGRFLGKGYSVQASVGHIRDLPSNRMGVDIEHDFTPRYVIPVKKRDVVKKLRAEAGRASAVYLATDPDREGEAIAWHLAAALERQIRDIPVHRVEFHEITRDAIGHAFDHPREIDQLRVDAQQARRILDRVVGFTLSPLLREKMGRRGLSAGRVQSVALRLLCEREREIQAFVPVEYWSIEAELRKQALASAGADEPEPDDASFIARLVRVRDTKPELKNEADAQAILRDLDGAVYVVARVTRRERLRNPSPPFTTSTLQQEASRKLGYTAKRTMGLAQALYEGKDIGDERVGLITYMRTDSVAVAESAQVEARSFLTARFGVDYVPGSPPQYRTRAKSAQEAHEAIRPTSVKREPSSLQPYLSRDELRLYTLIWQRFLASQMAPAVLDQTVVDVSAGREGGDRPYLFRASGSVVKFPGFLRIYGEKGADDAEEEGSGVPLPHLEAGEWLDLMRLLPQQHFTKPPPRYTDASLIRMFEAFGIGRPSTYAPTLATLLDRRYASREAKALVPTQLGFRVNDRLVQFFPDIVNTAFTAEMEEKLDRIAIGQQAWVPMLHGFFAPFAEAVEVARKRMPKEEFEPERTGDLCPDCGKPLLIRLGRYGRFIGCSGWPECRYTAPVPLPGITCPECGGAVLEKRTRRGRRFFGCENYRRDDETSCQWTSWKRPEAADTPTAT